MATNLDISAALAAANTTHQSFGEKLFSATLPGAYSLYTDVINNDGIWQNNFLANIPEMRQWVGARQEKSLRAYTETLTPTSWEATIALKRLDMTRDKTGAIAKAIAAFNQRNVSVFDRHVATTLDTSAGPSGFDATVLYSATHPNVNSGSGESNLSAGTNLSHANFTTARLTMQQHKLESGEPMGIKPTHMRIGFSLEARAKEILEATDRVVATDMAASESTTAVQDTTSVYNIWKGELAVIVDPRVGDVSSQNFYWELFDLSKERKPMTLVVERNIQAIARTDMDDPRRFEYDEFVFGLEGEFVAGAGLWPTAYLSSGTA